MWKIAGSNPTATIFHFENYLLLLITRFLTDSKTHLTTGACEFECVIHQVDHGLLQGLPLTQNTGCSFCLAGHGEMDRFIFSQWCECCNHFLCHLVEIDNLLVDLPGRVGLCQLE